MQTESANWVGQKLASGRFDVTAKLGAGGMGFVYLARDLQDRHDVVIKVPRQQMLTNPEFAGRFTREIRSLIRLVHDHIVKVIDVGEHDGRPFVVLDFLPGGSLRDRFDGTLDGRRGARPRAELKTWLPGIAAALDFCHQHKCVHRDVKPDNILFDAAGRAYLSDFGIAKVLGQTAPSQMTVMTAAGMVLGTPQYMAPELILGQGCDGQADQYALAITVYEALSGQLPVDGPTPAAILVQQATVTPVPLDQVRPNLSRLTSAAVARALAKKPGERFPSCTAFAETVLMALVSPDAKGRPAASPPAVPSPPRAPTPVAAPVPEDETLVGTPVKACPRCKKLCRLTPAQLGKMVRCPRCDTSFPASPKPTVPARPVLETEPVAQGAIRTPPSSPAVGRSFADAAHQAVARNWHRWMLAAVLLVGCFLVLLVGGGVAAYLLWPRKKLEVQLVEKAAVVQPGGEVTLSFKVKRTAFRGPVDISVTGLPESLRVESLTLADGEDTGKVVLTCTADAPETEANLTLVCKADTLSAEVPLKVTVEWSVGEVRLFKGHVGEVTAVAFSNDARFIASGGVKGDLRCWKVATGQQHGSTAFMPDPVAGLALSPDATRAVVSYAVPGGVKNLSLRQWTLGTDAPKEPAVFSGLYDPILAVGWPDDESVIAVVRRGQAPYVGRWTSATGGQSNLVAVDVETAVTSPGSKFILLMYRKGKTTATLWDVAGMKEQARFTVDLASYQALAVSAAGTTVALAASDGIQVWTVKGSSGSKAAQLSEPGKNVTALAVAPDGGRVLVGGSDGSVRLWDVAAKQQARSFAGHKGSVKCVEFSADGRLAVSGGADGTVRLWKLPPAGGPR